MGSSKSPKPLSKEEMVRQLALNRQRKIGKEIDVELKRQGLTRETAPRHVIARLFAHLIKSHQAKKELLIRERDGATIARAAGRKPSRGGSRGESPFPNRGPHRRPGNPPR